MKKYEITEEQLKAICIEIDLNQNSAINCIKEWFPEAFKPVLEAGKWYKFESGTLGFYQGDNIESYGVHATSKEWFSSHAWFFNHNLNEKIIEATESEVFEALKNESVKRGYEKENTFVKSIIFDDREVNLSCSGYDKTNFRLEHNGGFTYNGVTIFKKGKWAEIIETITKEEAEKKYNCKII